MNTMILCRDCEYFSATGMIIGKCKIDSLDDESLVVNCEHHCSKGIYRKEDKKKNELEYDCPCKHFDQCTECIYN